MLKLDSLPVELQERIWMHALACYQQQRAHIAHKKAMKEIPAAAVVLDVRRHCAYDQHDFGVFESTWINSRLLDNDIDHGQAPVSWDPDFDQIENMVVVKLQYATPACALRFVGNQSLRRTLVELELYVA